MLKYYVNLTFDRKGQGSIVNWPYEYHCLQCNSDESISDREVVIESYEPESISTGTEAETSLEPSLQSKLKPPTSIWFILDRMDVPSAICIFTLARNTVLCWNMLPCCMYDYGSIICQGLHTTSALNFYFRSCNLIAGLLAVKQIFTLLNGEYQKFCYYIIICSACRTSKLGMKGCSMQEFEVSISWWTVLSTFSLPIMSLTW